MTPLAPPTLSERTEWAAQLYDLALLINSMAEAMDSDDAILGSISGQGVANHLAALPKHIRDVFMEHLSDEAAAGIKADQRYWDSLAS